jgi:hypothetical protein
MAKRSSTPRVDMNDPAVQAILTTLLAEFTARGLTASDLHEDYEGPSPDDMREQCCTTGDFSDVDYDLAFKSLTAANLVKTGPMKMYDNPPNGGVFILGFYSQNKFTYLTETGYQQANRQRATKPRPVPAQHVHISGGTFNNSPIGVGHGVSQTLNLSTATTDQLIERLRDEVKLQIADEARQTQILDKLDALQAAPDNPTRLERYMQVMGAIGDHITVLSFSADAVDAQPPTPTFLEVKGDAQGELIQDTRDLGVIVESSLDRPLWIRTLSQRSSSSNSRSNTPRRG